MRLLQIPIDTELGELLEQIHAADQIGGPELLMHHEINEAKECLLASALLAITLGDRNAEIERGLLNAGFRHE